jgi:prepilin-type N-terminal cleavage/methylation domain-containing protein/prepilin-type processing-associated H-X9-DG protein
MHASSIDCRRGDASWPCVLRVRRQFGFTLIELLVVIAIVGVLLYLLMPGVQASRERARKLSCQNHLKQLVTAAQLHLNAQGYFPSGGWSGNFVADPSRGYGREQPGGWLFGLLEYMDESPLRKNAATESVSVTPLGPSLTALYTSAPPFFYCPSRREAKAYPFKQSGNGAWSLRVAQDLLLLPAVTKSDYAANSGDSVYSAAEQFSDEPQMWVPLSYDALKTMPVAWTITSDPRSSYFQNGICYYRSEVRPAQVQDGLSKTYFCGEKHLSPEFYDDVNPSNDPAMMGDNQSAWAGFEWDNHRVAWNPNDRWVKTAYQPQQDQPGTGFAGCFAFGSAHAGSFNMAFCDGSVHEVDYDVDEQVHRQQSNRMDGK